MMTDYRLWSSSDGTPFPLPLAHWPLLCLTGPVLRQCRPKACPPRTAPGGSWFGVSFFLLSYFVCIFSDFCCCHCCLLACLKSFSSGVRRQLMVGLVPLSVDPAVNQHNTVLHPGLGCFAGSINDPLLGEYSTQAKFPTSNLRHSISCCLLG